MKSMTSPAAILVLLLAASLCAACASSPTIGEGIERNPTETADNSDAVDVAYDATPELTVKVVGLRNDAGVVSVAIYDDPNAYPMEKDKVLEADKVDIPDGATEVELVFGDLPPGDYAIALLHDENESGDMDKNMLGMPEEGYGASRNPGARLGPPLWEDTHFALEGPMSVTIEVIY